MLDIIQAYPGVAVDLVVIDVRYHMPCINAYINKWRKRQTANSDVKDRDDNFVSLTEELHTQMIVNKCVVYPSAIRDRCRILLQEKGLKSGEITVQCNRKKLLQVHFRDS